MFDSYREVQARVHRQLEALDALIVEADREIERLQTLLAAARGRPLSGEDQQRAFELWETGLSPAEIARRLEADAQRVEQALDEFRDPRRRVA
jgi:hypothetical protein